MHAGRLLDATPMTLQRFVLSFADWVEHYNTRRPHRALGGATPLARWQQDCTPVRALDAAEARWMLLARTGPKVLKDGIHHGSRVYFAAELSGLRGDTVEIAHMPHDDRWIEVYHDGRWIATARPQEDLTDTERRAALERIRIAPITKPGLVEEIPSAPRVSEQKAAPVRAALRLLALEREVNQPLAEEPTSKRRPGR